MKNIFISKNNTRYNANNFNTKQYAYTDMADELDVSKDNTSSQNIKTTKVVLDAKQAYKLNKPKGTYITIQADTVVEQDRPDFMQVAMALKSALCNLGKFENCLVIGLGNQYLTADALGSNVTKHLLVTRHLVNKQGVGILSLLCPGVLGVTGIESGDIIKGVIDKTKPSCVIVVDSLASASTARIATAFQVSDAGIVPGSGIGNSRMILDKSTLGVPVYSVGVPLVVYATTILREFTTDVLDTTDIEDLIVTPKDIDILVLDCAKIIATAINLAVHKDMTTRDLQKLGLV